MRVEVYTAEQKKIWDDFVLASKNGTFMHMRNYMDYHSDRFTDASLLIYNMNNELVAIMPANQKDGNYYSHGGLTYGGIISKRSLDAVGMVEVFAAMLAFLKQQGLLQLFYKTIPSIYHTIPAEEDRYALFLCNAELIRRDLLSVINNTEKLPFQERRRRMIGKAQKAGFNVKQSQDFSSFWAVLARNLKTKYGISPVHSLAEIELLAAHFPENIKLFCCYQDDTVLAGVVVYETDTTAHAQYISVDDEGRKLGALDLVFHTLINETYAHKRYFDFGISNENNGRHLNKGLIEQKEGFGARGIVHDYYRIDLTQCDPDSLRGALQ